MRRWALVSGGSVVSVVEQDTAPAIEGRWVECLGAGPGWLYDGSAFAAPAVTQPRSITSYALKMRMTQAERVATRARAAADPVIYDFMDLLNSAPSVNLDLAPLIAGLNALVAVGILAPNRPDEIRADPILDSERP